MSHLYTRLTPESPTAKQPEKIKTEMKLHQLAALNYCTSIEEDKKINIDNKYFETSIGIIGDKVGSGKSLTALSIIANKPILRKTLDKQWTNGYINVSQKHNDISYIDINVIVVPHGLIKQWTNYIKNDTILKYVVVNTAKTIKPFKEDINKLRDYEVVLVSSTRYNELSDLLCPNYYTHLKVSRVFIDETDSIKIPACRKMYASFYWFITSSYKNLLHPDGEVRYTNGAGQYSNYYNYHDGFTDRVVLNGVECKGFVRDVLRQLYSLDNDIMKQIIVKNSNSFVESAFAIPKPNIIKLICKNPITLNILNNLINNDILSYINAGDVQGAIEKINCTKVNENNLIKTFTEELDISIANKKIEYDMKLQMTYSSENAKKISLERIQEKIQELESKKEAIKERIKENKVCSICYDKAENLTIPACCNGSFCFQCISLWLAQKSTCPLCRQNITMDKMVIVTDKNNKEEKTKEELLDKISQVKEIISNKLNDESKLLIFSEHNNSFTEIYSFLEASNKSYSKVMGHSSTINNIVNNFKLDNNHEKSISTLLLNSRYFGSGLNLENATDLIIFHNMSKELTQQVVGRAQRPGRKTPLNIYMLCNENEAFESVL